MNKDTVIAWVNLIVALLVVFYGRIPDAFPVMVVGVCAFGMHITIGNNTLVETIWCFADGVSTLILSMYLFFQFYYTLVYGTYHGLYVLVGVINALTFATIGEMPLSYFSHPEAKT